MEKNKGYFELTEYLWKYFEYHANQRITLIKFYIGFCGLFASAIGYLFVHIPTCKGELTLESIILLILSTFLIFVTRIFKSLDKRNEQLVEYAEESLRYLEENISKNVSKISIDDFEKVKIFTIENKDKKAGKSRKGHRQCFDSLFFAANFMGITLVILSIYKLQIIPFLCHLLT